MVKKLDLSYCEAEIVEGTEFTVEQQAAADAAEYDSVEDVVNLYALCAELGGQYATKNSELSEDQILEVSVG